MNFKDPNTLTARIQMYCLESSTTVPKEFEDPLFQQSFVELFLETKITVDEKDKTKFFKQVVQEIKHYKDLKRTPKTEEFKTRMKTEVQQLMKQYSQRESSESPNPEDPGWLEVDSVGYSADEGAQKKTSQNKKPEDKPSTSSEPKKPEVQASNASKSPQKKKTEDINEAKKKKQTDLSNWKIPKKNVEKVDDSPNNGSKIPDKGSKTSEVKKVVDRRASTSKPQKEQNPKENKMTNNESEKNKKVEKRRNSSVGEPQKKLKEANAALEKKTERKKSSEEPKENKISDNKNKKIEKRRNSSVGEPQKKLREEKATTSKDIPNKNSAVEKNERKKSSEEPEKPQKSKEIKKSENQNEKRRNSNVGDSPKKLREEKTPAVVEKESTSKEPLKMSKKPDSPLKKVMPIKNRRSSVAMPVLEKSKPDKIANPLERVKAIRNRRSSLTILLESANTEGQQKAPTIDKPAEKASTSNVEKVNDPKPKAINRRRLTVAKYQPPPSQLVPEDPPEVVVVPEKSPKKKKRKPGPKSRTMRSSSNIDDEIVASTVPFKENQNNNSYDISKFYDDKISKDLSLKTDGSLTNMCNYFMELNENTRMITMSKGLEQEKSSIDSLGIEEILFWPGIGIKIEVKGFTITRHLEPNIKQQAIKFECSNYLWDHKEPNSNEVFRYYATKKEKTLASLQKNVDISRNYLHTIIEIMIKCLSVCGKQQQKKFEPVFNAILDDIGRKDLERCFMNVPYSYFLNEYKYYRVFEHDVELSSDAKLIVEREFYNPQVVFNVVKCDYQELKPPNYEEVLAYFKSIMDKNEEDIEEFQTTLGKGFTLYCTGCNMSFKSANRRQLCEHLGAYRTKKLNCVKCGYESDMPELAKNSWKHDC